MILNISITSILLILFFCHQLKFMVIDFIGLALLGLSIVPWLSKILDSLELPGGFKIKYRDMALAFEKLKIKQSPKSVEKKWKSNANELINLGSEIEKALHETLEKNNILSSGDSLSMLNLAIKNKLFNSFQGMGLREIISLCNKAKHGIEIEDSVHIWVKYYGPLILRIIAGDSDEDGSWTPQVMVIGGGKKGLFASAFNEDAKYSISGQSCMIYFDVAFLAEKDFENCEIIISGLPLVPSIENTSPFAATMTFDSEFKEVVLCCVPNSASLTVNSIIDGKIVPVKIDKNWKKIRIQGNFISQF